MGTKCRERNLRGRKSCCLKVEKGRRKEKAWDVGKMGAEGREDKERIRKGRRAVRQNEGEI